MLEFTMKLFLVLVCATILFLWVIWALMYIDNQTEIPKDYQDYIPRNFNVSKL